MIAVGVSATLALDQFASQRIRCFIGAGWRQHDATSVERLQFAFTAVPASSQITERAARWYASTGQVDAQAVNLLGRDENRRAAIDEVADSKEVWHAGGE